MKPVRTRQDVGRMKRSPLRRKASFKESLKTLSSMERKAILKAYSPKKKMEYALDKLVSEYVRRRAMQRVGGCERCEAKKTDYKDLQWAHLWSRWHKSIRWNEDAAAGLCGGCHMLIDRDPEMKLALRVKLLGENRSVIMAMAATTPGKPDVAGETLYFKEKIKSLDRI